MGSKILQISILCLAMAMFWGAGVYSWAGNGHSEYVMVPAELEDVVEGDEHEGHKSESGCASSCSVEDPPGVELKKAEFLQLVGTWSKQPVGEATIELETLLFHFKRSKQLLHRLEPEVLDEEHRNFLEQELHRDQVSVEFRLVDESGELRGHVRAGEVPLKAKQHLVFADTGSLGRFEASGKVKRVGLNHLWSRW